MNTNNQINRKICKSISHVLTLFVYLFIYSFVYSNNVQAQQVTLSLDPPIVQTKIKPGKSILVAYTVENTGDPTNLQFLIRPFTPIGQQGSLTVERQLEGPIQFNLENADVVLEKPFFFASKEKRQAVIRIHVPLGIPDGDYYYMILAETVPAFSVGGQSTGIVSVSVGSPLLITITESGITEVKASIAEFSFQPDYVFTIGNKTVRVVDNIKDVPIVCSIRNMGKNFIQPNGTITHRSGGVKKEFTIIPQNILSNSQRIIKVDQDDNIRTDSTVVLTHLSVGYHSLSTQVSFGDNNTIIFKELSFVALPIRLITATSIVLVLVLFFFLIPHFQKKKKRRK